MSSSRNTTASSSKDARIVSLSEIPMFKGTNYLSWWPKMEMYLISTGCMWIANITEPPKPTSSSTPESVMQVDRLTLRSRVTYSEGGTHEEMLHPQSKARVMNKGQGGLGHNQTSCRFVRLML